MALVSVYECHYVYGSSEFLNQLDSKNILILASKMKKKETEKWDTSRRKKMCKTKEYKATISVCSICGILHNK